MQGAFGHADDGPRVWIKIRNSRFGRKKHWLVCPTSKTMSPWTQDKPTGSCLSLTQPQPTKATCHRVQGRPRRRALLLLFHIWMLEENSPCSWLILVHSHFTRHQNLKTHSGSERLTMKIGLWLIHCNEKTWPLQKLVRKKELWGALLILQLPFP